MRLHLLRVAMLVIALAGISSTTNAASVQTTDHANGLASAATIVTYDTLYVKSSSFVRKALTVSSIGSFGHCGIGRVNLDYGNHNDCDTLALVYLFDGSPIIGWLDGSDTIMNWSIYTDDSITSGASFIPYPASASDTAATGSCNYYTYARTRRLATSDYSIALEKIWYAPSQAYGDSAFILQCLKVWSLSGAKNGLTIGEAIDWDIPSDSGTANSSATNGQVIWQRGIDYDTTGPDSLNEGCQPDSIRFGGARLLYRYRNRNLEATSAHGAYTEVYDKSTASQPLSLNAGQLYADMGQAGFMPYGGTGDLRTVVTFARDIDLGPTDTLKFYSAIASVQYGTEAQFLKQFDAAAAWFVHRELAVNIDGICSPFLCCCMLNGDFNHNGTLNVADLNYFVAFLFLGGSYPSCIIEADVNRDSKINVVDLNILVSFFFLGGAPISPSCCPPCCD